MFLVLHESVFSVPIMSRTVCVTVNRGNKILTDGLLVNVISTSSLRELLENMDLVLADDDTVVVKCATTENGKQYDADLSNTVEQLLEFGRKYISFSVTTVTRAEVPAVKPLAPIFTQQARRDCLPQTPSSGAGGTQTAKDKLFQDVVNYLKKLKIGFAADICDSEGAYVVRSLTNALWSIDGCHNSLETLHEHRAVPQLDSTWYEFRGYNDYAAKKTKKPQLSATSLSSNSSILFGMLQKSCLQGKRWDSFRSGIEALAILFNKCALELNKDLVKAASRNRLSDVVRPISSYANVEVREAASFTYTMSSLESKLMTALASAGEYEPVYFSEVEILKCHLTPMQRYTFLRGFKLHIPVDVYRYSLGGNVGTMVFMWKAPADRPPSEVATRTASICEALKKDIPQYHTRHMRAEFASQCAHLTGISPAVRRFLYGQLTDDASTSENPAVEERLHLVCLGELPEICADLRSASPDIGRPGQFDEFLCILQELIRDVSAEDERRNRVAHMSHFLSQRDLYEQAKAKCSDDTPVPSLAWVALQYQPKSSQAHSALRYTGKLDVRYAVQSRQLRAHHEDDHYCLSLFKLQRAMCVSLRQYSSFVCLDDKAKIPVGEPDHFMATGVRSRAGLVAGGSSLQALDHDQASRGSLTPSVALECTVPEEAGGSFYNGTLHVLVKDTVLQPSSPFRHSVELASILSPSPTQAASPIIFAYTDGGADHRCTFLSVQLAWILLFQQLDLDLLVACRTAPGHSYVNPAERCMSTLNLGLQNCALAREPVSDDVEKRLRNCGGMSAIRKEQKVVQDGWAKSVDPVKQIVNDRFKRLVYSGEPVVTHDPAPAAAIAEFVAAVHNVDASIECRADLGQKDLKGKKRLQEFIESHCNVRHYSFQVKKCGLSPCLFGICQEPRLPLDDFGKLNWLPDPTPDPDSPGHYQQFDSLYGKDTTGDHRPSNKTKPGDSSTQQADQQGCSNSFFTAQRVRKAVHCSECGKPRCVYAKVNLSHDEESQLQSTVDEFGYTCGSPILPPENALYRRVFVRQPGRCQDPVELAFYSSKIGSGICCYCASSDAFRPQQYLEKFFTVLPICDSCMQERPVITKRPKAGSKRKANEE